MKKINNIQEYVIKKTTFEQITTSTNSLYNSFILHKKAKKNLSNFSKGKTKIEIEMHIQVYIGYQNAVTPQFFIDLTSSLEDFVTQQNKDFIGKKQFTYKMITQPNPKNPEIMDWEGAVVPALKESQWTTIEKWRKEKTIEEIRKDVHQKYINSVNDDKEVDGLINNDAASFLKNNPDYTLQQCRDHVINENVDLLVLMELAKNHNQLPAEQNGTLKFFLLLHMKSALKNSYQYIFSNHPNRHFVQPIPIKTAKMIAKERIATDIPAIQSDINELQQLSQIRSLASQSNNKILTPEHFSLTESNTGKEFDNNNGSEKDINLMEMEMPEEQKKKVEIETAVNNHTAKTKSPWEIQNPTISVNTKGKDPVDSREISPIVSPLSSPTLKHTTTQHQMMMFGNKQLTPEQFAEDLAEALWKENMSAETIGKALGVFYRETSKPNAFKK